MLKQLDADDDSPIDPSGDMYRVGCNDLDLDKLLLKQLQRLETVLTVVGPSTIKKSWPQCEATMNHIIDLIQSSGIHTTF